MNIRLGSREYPLDDSWMTALRYRARYGASFLYADTTQPGVKSMALARLCYVGIIGDKPSEAQFMRDAMADALFLRAAEAYQAFLYRPDASTDGIRGEGNGDKADELHTAAAWAHCRLPERLLGELCVSQVAGLLHIYHDLQSSAQKPRPMDMDEQAGIYGISGKAEQQIAEYLKGVRGDVVQSGNCKGNTDAFYD